MIFPRSSGFSKRLAACLRKSRSSSGQDSGTRQTEGTFLAEEL